MRVAAKVVDVVHYGLGPIGVGVAGMVRQRPSLRSVAAVDIAPELNGKELGVLCGGAPDGVLVTAPNECPAVAGGVAVHCTGSRLSTVAPQLLDLVSRGLSVVSTCEELSYPWDEAPEIADSLDRAARAVGVSIVGTGVNPGFAMDTLPLTLTGVTNGVRSVRVHRVQNASQRRAPLQRKVGAGLSVAEFEQRRAAGSIGHVGLRESAQAIAGGLGWRLDRLDESLEPAIAQRRLEVAVGTIHAGEVAGIEHTVVGFIDGREVIRLKLEMALDRPDARDVITIDAAPPIEMTILGGLHGDTATASIVTNTISRILAAPPGLRTMAELQPPRAEEGP